MVERTTRHTSSERARPDSQWAVPARSLDVCLDSDGPFIDLSPVLRCSVLIRFLRNLRNCYVNAAV